MRSAPTRLAHAAPAHASRSALQAPPRSRVEQYTDYLHHHQLPLG